MKHLFRYGGVKNSLIPQGYAEMLIDSCKLRFLDNFCLALTKNLHRAKVLYYYSLRFDSRIFNDHGGTRGFTHGNTQFI